MNIAKPASTAAVARTDRALPRHRRRQICGHRSGRHRALPHRGARPVSRPLAAGAAAGLDRGSLRDLQACQRDRASRSCRRAAIPGWSAARPRTTARWWSRCGGWTRSARSTPPRNTMTCEAGVVLQVAQQARAEVDRLFPLSLGAEGSCTIGGNLSTNAGGTARARLWRARELALGLEVVLADGRDPERPVEAEEGQHRLRPAQPLHRRRRHARHHHRRRC